jgi:integrase
MASITFFIQSKSKVAGIYIRLRDGKDIDAKAKTRFIINPNDWSVSKSQPKNLKDEAFKKLNSDLLELNKKVLDYYNSSIGKSTIDSMWLKEFLNPLPKESQITDNLVNYFDFYIKDKKSEITESSIKKLIVVKHLLMRFESKKKKTYLIKNVDSDFKLKFEDYCLSQNYAPNTIARAINFIKTICFHARLKGVESNFQLDSITTKYNKSIKIYLTPEELKKIDNVNLEAEYLSNSRDWLIISCETGQRVSDFLRFNKGMIRKEDGKNLIEFEQVKTRKLMTVPLSKKVMAILKKRNGEFPRSLSDQKYNDYIKEVCRLAGLTNKVKGSRMNPDTNRKEDGTFQKWELVSSHIGRRTFATNYYGKIPTSLLISATGHSTESLFLEYIGKSNSDKAKQLAEYF